MEEGVMGDHENWEEEEKREIRELGEDQIMFVISIICFIFFETSPSVSHSFHYPWILSLWVFSHRKEF